MEAIFPRINIYLKLVFFAELTHNDISWVYRDLEKDLQRKKWQKSITNCFDPRFAIDSHLERRQTWNQAGYDAIFADTEKKLVQFVQVTGAKQHKNFHHIDFVEVMNKLAEENGLGPFDVVEVCFVVLECNLEKLRRF